MTRESKVKTGIVIGVMIFLVAICIVVIVFQKEPTVQEPNFGPTSPLSMSLVDEYSTFFALSRDVNQYFTYVREANSEAVYSMLYSRYIDENQLTESNVLDTVTLENPDQYFQAKNIYYQEFNGNYLYLVEGVLIVNEFENNVVINDDYQIFVIADYNTFSFAVYPILNTEEITNPLVEDRISIPVNNYNKLLTTGVISSEYVCNLYYSNFISQVFENVGETYDLLSSSFKNQYNINSYTSYMSERLSFISTEVSNCDVHLENEKRVYTVTDTNSNQFVFREKSIMNYEVEFSFNAG
ncbi:TPA: hypothetical protein IAB29_06730 [Candidatus Ventrenecus stercoripullorum]|nr:hypothetical protein [Candidatus Ventrenecus stercoripullorum]